MARQKNNFITRLLSGLLVAAVATWFIYWGGEMFLVLVALVTTLMALEYKNLVQSRQNTSHFLWYLAGVFYLLAPALSIVVLRFFNMDALIWLVLTVTATDIGGYVFGKAFGKHKLAPIISPKKTWEGLGGAVLFAAIVSFLFMSDITYGLLGAALAIISQMGDLTESKIKRYFGVKDSGHIIPGHGGLMDRLDGYLYAAPVMVLWHLYKVV